MKKLYNYIIEKFIINKNSKVNNYVFDGITPVIKIHLPFTLTFPDINKKTEIINIDTEEDEFGEKIWRFYEKDNEGISDKNQLSVMNLSGRGVKNVFFKNAKDVMPLIFNINGYNYGKRLKVKVENLSDVLFSESLTDINEKFIINKNTKKQNILFNFTDDLGVELPFNLKITGRNVVTVTITDIKKSQSGIWFDLYDDKGRHIVKLNDKYVKCLFVFATHKAILYLQDKELQNEVGRENTVIFYKDDLEKIITK